MESNFFVVIKNILVIKESLGNMMGNDGDKRGLKLIIVFINDSYVAFTITKHKMFQSEIKYLRYAVLTLFK